MAIRSKVIRKKKKKSLRPDFSVHLPVVVRGHFDSSLLFLMLLITVKIAARQTNLVPSWVLIFACDRREQTTVQKCHKIVKNVKIVKFHGHIWNHNENCIQISTNMPGIGSLIRQIAVNISEI